MQETTDEELMQQAAVRGPEPLAVLFDRHHRKLLTFFVKLGHGRTGSEDLVQETFLRMLRYARSFRPDARFTPWMYQIARNAASDAFHARSREELCDDKTLESFAEAAQGPDSAHNLGQTEQRLQRALLMLAREKRELVLLSRVRQLGTDELASLLGCSATAVKVRLHRSLAELRGYFDALEDNATPSIPKARQAELK